MSTNRHLRIIVVLAEAKQPLSIIQLVTEINERYSKNYSPGLIGGDLKKIIADGKAKIDDFKCFSSTEAGIVCANKIKKEALLDLEGVETSSDKWAKQA